ncbi:hypothetical protein TWF281_010544 [Arthrobotrys megalospora]
MRSVHEVEDCLSNPSRIQYALLSFSQEFRASLLQLSRSKILENQSQGSNEIHLLLNRLDRVMAIVVYLSSRDDLVLKKSQIEFLQEKGALRLNRGIEYGEIAATILNGMVDIYDLISQTMVQSVRDAWYRQAMYRRIEESATLVILNSKVPYNYDMIGREQFIQGFFERARGYNFWIVRQCAPNREGVPIRTDRFPAWIVENIGLVQSQADPIVFAHFYEKLRGENRFRGLPVKTVPFLPVTLPEILSQGEGATGDQMVESNDNAETEEQSDSSKDENSPISIKAAEKIQKNWRICSSLIRNRRYLGQDPIHRRITRILESLVIPLDSNNEIFRKRFRLFGFMLLDLIKTIRYKLGATAARLREVGRKKGSMEIMEKIMAGDELFRGYRDKMKAIEKSIEPSSLASTTGKKSILLEVLDIIRETKTLQEKVSSSTSDLESWIQGCA